MVVGSGAWKAGRPGSALESGFVHRARLLQRQAPGSRDWSSGVQLRLEWRPCGMHLGSKGHCMAPGLHTPGACGPMACLSLRPPLGLQDQYQLGVLHSILHQKESEGERVAAPEKVLCAW